MNKYTALIGGLSVSALVLAALVVFLPGNDALANNNPSTSQDYILFTVPKKVDTKEVYLSVMDQRTNKIVVYELKSSRLVPVAGGDVSSAFVKQP
ncbi:MAG: hypothetical protein WCJ97_05065 [Phycisphaerae bacterium]